MATTLTRYEPRTGLTRLSDLVDRLFRESFVMPSVLDRWMGEFAGVALASNLLETGDSYIMQVALPGINPDKLDVQVTGRQVRIHGWYETPIPENATFIWQGIPTGEFTESFTLPADIQSDKVEAQYEHGILKLMIPKAEQAQTKSIKVAVAK